MVDKKTVGNAGGGLIHVIWNEHGHEAARDFFNQTQKVSKRYSNNLFLDCKLLALESWVYYWNWRYYCR